MKISEKRMMNNVLSFRKLFAVSLILLFGAIDLFPQDTVVVQTLTFNDIIKRRGTWTFPDNGDAYRKILMVKTLKCDRQTARDVFPCGEWDYNSYIDLFEHTGVMDSSLKTAPKYNWGSGNPDELNYTTEPTYTTFQKNYQKMVYDNVVSETETVLGDGAEDLTLENKPTRFQVLFTKDMVKSNELSGKNINRLKVYVKTPGITLKNFTVKIAKASEKSLDGFKSSMGDNFYEGDITFENEGWNYINLLNSFNINALFGVNIEMSYDAIEGGDNLILAADPFEDCLISDQQDGFLEFDGGYDYVRGGVIEKLKGAQKFTVEMKLKIDAWRNNGYIFRLGNGMELKIIDERTWAGGSWPDLYRFLVRNGENYGYYVGGGVDFTGNWRHIAFVYDGTKGQYDGRVRFFLNGSEVSGNIRGAFPEEFSSDDQILKLINNGNNINGDIDEFRIWTDALDIETITNWNDKTIDDTHPNYDNLAVYYSMNSFDGYVLKDESGNGYDADLIGAPAKRFLETSSQALNSRPLVNKPQLTLIEGEYESHTENELIEYNEETAPKTVVTYKVDGREVVVDNIEYVWEPGTFYTYDPDGNKIDSVVVEATNTITQEALEYYTEPAEVTKRWELGRYITPYGINLDLGDGFTWIYDVTDFVQLLKGEVDIAAGDQLELIDLKFLFIKGTPPRDVLKIDPIWGGRESCKYKDIDNDVKCPPINKELLPDAKQFKAKLRLTGHGHNTSNSGGAYPHCCEWKDNTHYFFANNDQIGEWHIWRPERCAQNPIYPQGGTWLGAREGWCPGDIVDDYEFELTKYITSNSVNLDYAVEPVPYDNPGMGNGNYLVTAYLVQYGASNFNNDIEIYDVITPSSQDMNSRKNPVCSGINIIVRNNGVEPVNNIEFKYGVSGGDEETYTWASATGEIKPNEKMAITLPVPNTDFWFGDGKNEMNVKVSEVNGKADDYNNNSDFVSNFLMPDVYKQAVELRLMTNNYSMSRLAVKIMDVEGNVVFERSNYTNQKLFTENLDFPDGCYTLEVTHSEHYGLAYVMISELTEGSLGIYDKSGNELKVFEPDFGYKLSYSFLIGEYNYVEEPNFHLNSSVYPNPAGDFLNIRIVDMNGLAVIDVYNMNGEIVNSFSASVSDSNDTKVNIGGLPAGAYFVKVKCNGKMFSKKFIKE